MINTMLISLVSVVVVIIPESDQYPYSTDTGPQPYFRIIRDDDFNSTGDEFQYAKQLHFPSFFIFCN